MNTTAPVTPHEPILVELDDKTWDAYLDSTEQWLDNVLTIQSTFANLAEDVQQKIREPHFKELLGGIAETAREHEREAEALYRVIGRDPAKWRKTSGATIAQLRKGMADLIGLAGGASAPWRDLQQLHLVSLNATSAFGAAEQLGYSLGLRELAEECFRIIAEKHPHTLILQELTLETVPWAILYKTSI